MPQLATTDDVLQAFREHPEIAVYAVMVGRWCWVSFPSKPSPDTRAFLRDAGFHWNKERAAWQHPCGYHSRRAPYDPRDKYTSVAIEELTR